MRPAYLDNNATTRVDPEVVAAMLPYFTEHFGNASSVHASAGRVGAAMASARRSVQQLLGAADPSEVVFTSGGTEADNLAIAAAIGALSGRDEIVTTRVEHAAVLACCRHWEQEKGIRVRLVPVDGRGRLDVEAYRRALGPRTALASVMLANNETGTLFPVDELASLAHDAGALFHTDAVQAVGKVPIDVQAAQIDMLSLSGHKLHAPKGVGALYVRRGVRLRPVLRGGRQERGRRPGTENVPGVVGLGCAAELARARMREGTARMRALRDRLEQGVIAQVERCVVLGDRDHRIANTATIAFEGVDGDQLVRRLADADIAVSSGAACSSGMVEPSHVLRAMNVPLIAARGAIRFSLSRDSDDSDVARVLAAVPALVRFLREGSAPWRRVQPQGTIPPGDPNKTLPETSQACL
ncbi:MAG: cysteine desulfurase NifS [Polyangiaceae bacterium]|jgi:cysteine desulfurase